MMDSDKLFRLYSNIFICHNLWRLLTGLVPCWSQHIADEELIETKSKEKSGYACRQRKPPRELSIISASSFEDMSHKSSKQSLVSRLPSELGLINSTNTRAKRQLLTFCLVMKWPCMPSLSHELIIMMKLTEAWTQ